MPYIIVDSTAPQKSVLQRLKQDLIKCVNSANEINRELDEMDDTQVTAQYGVPSGSVTAFRNNIDTLLVALEGVAVTNIISNVGFTQ